MKTNAERVLEYLWSVGPRGATNGEILKATGIQSHQSLYMLTQELMGRGKIQGRKQGSQWIFSLDESPEALLESVSRAAPGAPVPRLTAAQFEALARQVLSAHYGAPLEAGQVGGVPKRFDLVSPDGSIAGDAKYFTLVRGKRLPPAKFSIIAEHVWLLEKTGAREKFLVFGHDSEMPKRWLERYGHLRAGVGFYFLTNDGSLEELA